MILSLAVAALLSAAPAAPAWPSLSPPLGHLGAVVEPVPAGGVPEHTLVATFPGCEPQAISLLRALGGTARAVEQLQGWLDSVPGLEKKLFARPGALAAVVKHLADARWSGQRACAAPPLAEGFKLGLTSPPAKWCPVPADAVTGDFWFNGGSRAAAAIEVQPGSAKPCRPRVSVVLFDAAGTARVRLHADWAGVSSVTLVGDRCQVVDFTFSTDKQLFEPTLKSCKR